MRIIIGILLLVLFWGLALWSLGSGIADLYTYFFTQMETPATGGQVAWAVLRVVPLAEILAAIGWFTGGFTMFMGAEKRRW